MAGRWIFKGFVAGKKISKDDNRESPFGLVYEFVADVEDGSIPDLPVPNIAGFIFGIDFKKDTVTPPNNLTLIQKTRNGHAQWSPAKLTDSGWREPDTPRSAVAGWIISAAQDSTATNGAKGTVTIHIG